MPQARRLFLDTAFDADTITMMGETFDSAWRMIEAAFNLQPQATIDDARTILAKAILYRVSLGLQADFAKDEALRAVKFNYPNLLI